MRGVSGRATPVRWVWAAAELTSVAAAGRTPVAPEVGTPSRGSGHGCRPWRTGQSVLAQSIVTGGFGLAANPVHPDTTPDGVIHR